MPTINAYHPAGLRLCGASRQTMLILAADVQLLRSYLCPATHPACDERPRGPRLTQKLSLPW
jgi:hypothetical protein